MGIVVYGEAAGIHADFAFFSGDEFFLESGEGVVEAHRKRLLGIH
jgi:hypothetical protein